MNESRQIQQPTNTPMNRKRVIFWMTVEIGVILLVMTTVLLGSIPPWPVWLFFAISHGFFCTVVWQTKPYPGPHRPPMTNPPLPGMDQVD